MNAFTTCLLHTSLCTVLLSSCNTTPDAESDTFGSLSVTEVHDALQSPQIAVTPLLPGWLLEPRNIILLTHEDRLTLVEIANRGIVRQIPEEYYDSPEQGNRNDDSSILFYLYASDAQCLGCRVIKGQRVLIDDLELKPEDTKKLYKLLIPYIKKMQSHVTPQQKAAAAEMATQKALDQVQAAKKESTNPSNTP